MPPKPLNIRDSGISETCRPSTPSGSGLDPVTDNNSLRSFEKSEIVSPISEHVSYLHQAAARDLPAHHPHLTKHHSRRHPWRIYLSLTYLRRPPQEGWREDSMDGVVPLGNLQIDFSYPCLCCPKATKPPTEEKGSQATWQSVREYRLRETRKACVVGVVLDIFLGWLAFS